MTIISTCCSESAQFWTRSMVSLLNVANPCFRKCHLFEQLSPLEISIPVVLSEVIPTFFSIAKKRSGGGCSNPRKITVKYFKSNCRRILRCPSTERIGSSYLFLKERRRKRERVIFVLLLIHLVQRRRWPKVYLFCPLGILGLLVENIDVIIRERKREILCSALCLSIASCNLWSITDFCFSVCAKESFQKSNFIRSVFLASANLFAK